MSSDSNNPRHDPILIEFVDEAITDPVELRKLGKRRLPYKWPRWLLWTIASGAVALALVVGLLIGHFAF